MDYTYLNLIITIFSIYYTKDNKFISFKINDSSYMIDIWSFYHFMFGIIYNLVVKNINIKNKLFYGVIGHILFEYWENSKEGIKLIKKNFQIIMVIN